MCAVVVLCQWQVLALSACVHKWSSVRSLIARSQPSSLHSHRPFHHLGVSSSSENRATGTREQEDGLLCIPAPLLHAHSSLLAARTPTQTPPAIARPPQQVLPGQKSPRRLPRCGRRVAGSREGASAAERIRPIGRGGEREGAQGGGKDEEGSRPRGARGAGHHQEGQARHLRLLRDARRGGVPRQDLDAHLHRQGPAGEGELLPGDGGPAVRRGRAENRERSVPGPRRQPYVRGEAVVEEEDPSLRLRAPPRQGRAVGSPGDRPRRRRHEQGAEQQGPILPVVLRGRGDRRGAGQGRGHRILVPVQACPGVKKLRTWVQFRVGHVCSSDNLCVHG